MIKAILTLICLIFLAACDTGYFSEDAGISIKQFVFILPESYTGDVTYFASVQEAYLEKGQALRFVAGYSINDMLSTDDSTSKYYQSFLWDIDGKTYNTLSFRHTFQETGIHYGSLTTIDLFDDTLVTPITIYVNTPEKMVLEFPYDGYNLAEPTTTSELPFRWTLHGLDPWENADCEIYISSYRENVWNNMVGDLDCEDQATLWGPLLGNEDWVFSNYGINVKDSSVTFYWGIKYTVYSNGTTKLLDSTETFHFSTKILNDNYSIVKIPISYEGTSTDVKTRIYFVSAKGDTLKTINNNKNFTTISAKIAPQSGVKVYLQETSKTDFAPESLIIDIPRNTVLTTDTIVFKDNVPPQIAPSSEIQPYEECIEFLLFDDGTGINENRIAATMDDFPLNIDFTGHSVCVYHKCADYDSKCSIKIYAEDYARNATPELYWNIVLKKEDGSAVVKGPFLKEDEQ